MSVNAKLRVHVADITIHVYRNPQLGKLQVLAYIVG